MRWAALVALCLSASAVLAQDAHHGASPLAADQRRSGFVSEMDAGMQRMMRNMHAPGYSGNADIDFLAMMIPHHEGAVEMARLLLVHGHDPHTRKLAEEILVSQTVEIASMKRRLEALRAVAGRDEEDFPALGGNRGPVPP